MMRNRFGYVLLLAAIVLLPLVASAQSAEYPVLDSHSFARYFGNNEVTTTINLRAGGEFSPGHRAYLQIDLDSEVTTNGVMPRTAILNGYVVIALPKGLELDGQPRLQYYDTASGRFEFMYSKAYPQLSRFAGIESAMDDAASSNPQRILNGITEVTRALDPGITVSGPTDARLSGSNPQFALTGVSWLIPCNVMFKELVGLFDPETGISSSVKLRVNVPLKSGESLQNPSVVVFTGGLSAAVDQAMMLPADIPVTAITLVPLPVTETVTTSETPADDSSATESTSTPTTEDTTRPKRKPSSSRDTGGRSSAGTDGQDEEPDIVSPPPPGVLTENENTPEEITTQPAPEPIPVLVYSYDWLAWETELDLSPVVMPLITPDATPVPAVETTPDSGRLSERFDEQPTGITSVGTSALEAERPLRNPPEIAPVVETTPTPTATPVSIQATDPPEEVSQDSGVKQVELGTLPDKPQTYTVPLKPITGTEPADGSFRPQRDSASSSTGAGALPTTMGTTTGGGFSAGAYTPPVDLGEMILIPEGYFLMGTSSTASAGDADETPQSQVYLPSYYIDKYPVTNRQFHNFVISAGYKPEGNWDKYYIQGTADLPVRGVGWDDATAYAAWAGKRLPTEAEWEKAARGEAGATYPWGEEWSADILPRGNDMHAIMTATTAASPYGVMGMVGLVWQWTSSAHHDYPYNPDARGPKRVLRGGAYSNGRAIVRCANRYPEPGNVALNTFSFRCAKDS